MSQEYIMDAVYRNLQSLRGKHSTDEEFNLAVAIGILEGRAREIGDLKFHFGGKDFTPLVHDFEPYDVIPNSPSYNLSPRLCI